MKNLFDEETAELQNIVFALLTRPPFISRKSNKRACIKRAQEMCKRKFQHPRLVSSHETIQFRKRFACNCSRARAPSHPLLHPLLQS